MIRPTERCPTCFERFWTEAELKEHVEQEHGALGLGMHHSRRPKGLDPEIWKNG